VPAPEVLLIGAAKAGTTSLAAHLAAHPALFLPAVSEPSTLAWDVGTASAPRRFPSDLPADVPVRADSDWRALFEAAGSRRGIDASPLYLESTLAPARAAALQPPPRVVVSLRDPTRRAWADLWMHRAAGARPGDPASHLVAGAHELEGGDYAALLGPGLATGLAVLCLVFEEWTADIGAANRALGAHLDVDPAAFPVDPPRLNAGHRTVGPPVPARVRAAAERFAPRPLAALRARAPRRSTPPLPADIERRLRQHFAPSIASLESMLGRDLPWPR
jgi:hypothetical protein